MALLIAGERSGVGKTTVTLALLATLRRWQISVQSFKVGPDYIDPMFHAAVTGRSCRNLDPVLTSEAYVQQCFHQHQATANCALVEGVMGLFDGASGHSDWASPAHMARLLHLPILLVVDCSRMARSIAAIVHGYCSLDPRLSVAGVVLNRVGSDRHLQLLTAALAPLQVPILGVLHRQDEITLPDRHLGLIPTAELPELNAVLDRLASLGEQAFDWDQLLPLLKQPPQPSAVTPTPGFSFALQTKPRIAVAFDRAFSFYYADNLDCLSQLGAELVFWSPMADADLPPEVSGLYFGGGFPEVFAAELAENQAARQAVRSAIQQGIPTYGECGGLMYLSESVIDFDGRSYPMVGVLPTQAEMGKRLTLGYRQATTQQDSVLLPAGATVWGHEFHRSRLVQAPHPALYHLQGYETPIAPDQEGWQQGSVQASYVHLHWGATPQVPARWLSACDRFARSRHYGVAEQP
ncbi:MAG: cobyrinate a,c-diamide synthase [Elainella sp. Prado103]|nr:cobyrinate a,c-diamide synthase [Elainella sp. Prado103]